MTNPNDPCPFTQLMLINQNISAVDDPIIIFEMNRKARELMVEIEKIKQIKTVSITLNLN